MKEIFKGMDDAISLFNNVSEKLKRYNSNDMSINIVIDDTDTMSQIFVEIETDDGKSICIGSEESTDEGLRKIRITIADILGHKKL